MWIVPGWLVGPAPPAVVARPDRPTILAGASPRGQEPALDLLDLVWTSSGPDVPQRNAGKMGRSSACLDILDFFPGPSRLPVTLAGSYRGRKAESFRRRGCGTSPECPEGRLDPGIFQCFVAGPRSRRGPDGAAEVQTGAWAGRLATMSGWRIGAARRSGREALRLIRSGATPPRV